MPLAPVCVPYLAAIEQRHRRRRRDRGVDDVRLVVVLLGQIRGEPDELAVGGPRQAPREHGDGRVDIAVRAIGAELDRRLRIRRRHHVELVAIVDGDAVHHERDLGAIRRDPDRRDLDVRLTGDEQRRRVAIHARRVEIEPALLRRIGDERDPAPGGVEHRQRVGRRDGDGRRADRKRGIAVEADRDARVVDEHISCDPDPAVIRGHRRAVVGCVGRAAHRPRARRCAGPRRAWWCHRHRTQRRRRSGPFDGDAWAGPILSLRRCPIESKPTSTFNGLVIPATRPASA